ncbi:phospholipase D domain protein, partial [Ancylostoma duodenale]
GQLIYDTLLKTAQRGVNVKIAQTYKPEGVPETSDLAAKSNGRIKVRSLDFTQWYPGGILHTKSWAVDGKHLYVGSANFDWRALTQVRELGLAVFNCPCLANDLGRLLEIYWEMGAPGAKIPKSWPASLSTPAYHERPTSVPQEKGDQAVYFSASPPGFQSCGREDDLDAMVKLIDEAQ